MTVDVAEKLEYWAFKFCGKGEQEDAASDVMSEASKEIRKMREALRWYAADSNYRTRSVLMCGHGEGQSVLLDRGNRARNALKEKP